MSGFNQFELIEHFNLSNAELLPKAIRLGSHIRPEAMLFRLLIGSTKIKNNITQDIIEQKNNYSYLGVKQNSKFSKKMFYEFLGGSNELIKIDTYFKTSNPKNIPLFKDLINEYCLYFDYQHTRQYTLSFLHLYRILERISYTFPMLYASKATDYVGTWTKLQTYFQESNSELGFFNLFIKSFFDNDFLEAKVKIILTAHNDEIQKRYFKIIRNLCSEGNPTINIASYGEYDDITIENRDLINLMVKIRNRYFHFASGGQRNINSNDLLEPNQFFKCLNDHFANWLSFTYFELLKNAVQ